MKNEEIENVKRTASKFQKIVQDPEELLRYLTEDRAS